MNGLWSRRLSASLVTQISRLSTGLATWSPTLSAEGGSLLKHITDNAADARVVESFGNGLLAGIVAIVTRISNPYLEDTVERVGRAPMRKVSRKERFIGPASVSVQAGQSDSSISRRVLLEDLGQLHTLLVTFHILEQSDAK
jgi:hypothetical protein